MTRVAVLVVLGFLTWRFPEQCTAAVLWVGHAIAPLVTAGGEVAGEWAKSLLPGA